MRLLFIIQGEGRGHLTQAMAMERMLAAHGHRVVRMLVGRSSRREPPGFFEKGVTAEVEYFRSVNFIASKDHRHPSMFKTVLANALTVFRFLPSVLRLREAIRSVSPDVVVNFYELLGTFAYRLTDRKIPMVCIAHQFLFLHKDMKLPRRGYEGQGALNFFSRSIAAGCTEILALSFRKMEADPARKITVTPPLLRPEVLAFRPADGVDAPELRRGGYLLGYLLNAGFAEEVRAWHRKHREVELHFFWDNVEHGKVYREDETLVFYYLDDREFLRQMAGCRAYASTAGFESVCEAMYLGKPLMVVPSHIEQKCNAFDATRFHAAVSADRFDLSVLLDFAENDFRPDTAFPAWVRSAETEIVGALERIVAERRASNRRRRRGGPA